MHRSGTSALAGVLSMLGVDAGHALMPAHEGINPKGFWEHAEIWAIHEKLLEDLDSSWDDERFLPESWWKQSNISYYRAALRDILEQDFSRSSLWIVKDPRMCRLLPLWLDVLQDVDVKPHFILSMRSPIEVAQSLEHRDGFSMDKSKLLWLEHLLDAERWSRGHPRVVVTYDQLLDDWEATSRHIAKGLGLVFPCQTSDPGVIEQIRKFLEPALRHHNADKEAAPADQLSQLALDAFRITTIVPTERLGDALVSIDEHVKKIGIMVSPWVTQVRALNQLTKELEFRNAHLTQSNIHLVGEVARIKSTVSWQVTKPLRFIANLPRSFRKASRLS